MLETRRTSKLHLNAVIGQATTLLKLFPTFFFDRSTSVAQIMYSVSMKAGILEYKLSTEVRQLCHFAEDKTTVAGTQDISPEVFKEVQQDMKALIHGEHQSLEPPEKKLRQNESMPSNPPTSAGQNGDDAANLPPNPTVPIPQGMHLCEL